MPENLLKIGDTVTSLIDMGQIKKGELGHIEYILIKEKGTTYLVKFGFGNFLSLFAHEIRRSINGE